MAEPDPAARKRALRGEALAFREQLPAAVVARSGPLLAAVLRPHLPGPGGVVALYVSTGREPGTRDLLADLSGTVEVLLPVLLPGGDLDWAAYDGRLVAGPHGLLEPPGPRLGPAAVAAAEVLVVPALAVDPRGRRLGRGGGSYDRALARTAALAIALLHDGEFVDEVPAEPHDRPVAAVASPVAGLRRVAGKMEA